MANIVYTFAVSVDGFMEDQDKSIDWHQVDDEVHTHFNEWLGRAGAFLEGRVTYQMMRTSGRRPTRSRSVLPP